ncbi:hypothetical protein F938_00424 [Acinetobacter bereziniae LMG 1003 = CIP 70.12]|uniref:Uncharacterized protein n=1 Tax=Acinetobacter bereziniae LMG 1003 = CIP 70.12 TaxID=981324 RepID=N9DRP7_ACIBZ|nr:hypothetical protein [Acinetobacter bereziniae]ENW00908.1 hypothetical protein F938_00424 [Acinetobacter bereziniae LMG 1003 = CIP 70.12]MCU4319398.1 hypothetical protein [Acinetobacter bereziniae]
MTKQYIARQKVGRFSKGDTVGGLTEAQIKQLETDKIIEEVKSAQTKPSKEVKTDG